jgi:hypothetical protein
MTSGMRIAVTGLAATYPLGGVFWDYLQYALGLHRLGHEVLYIEDTGRWCYDPRGVTFIEDGTRNARWLARKLAALEPELADRWFFRDATGRTFGRAWPDVVRFCREADLFLNVSASCWMRDEYFATERVAFLDSDPVYTQAWVPAYVADSATPEERSRIEMMRRHDAFFTFGENIGAIDCAVPTELFDWMPTRQPVVLDLFWAATKPPSARRRVCTTVASWEPTEVGPTVSGVTYTGKSAEFERFIDLPARSALPLELAISGRPPLPRLRRSGWRLRDGFAVSYDPWVYLDYLASSTAEFSVAKNAYVAARTGWFSTRTACYLALGVPAVVQDTGFGRLIPTGEGLLTFATVDEAADAIERVASEPERHSRAARALARVYFDSDRVLTELLNRAFAPTGRAL